MTSGCDTKLNEAPVTPTTDSTDDVMVATAEQLQGYAKVSVNKALSEAANTITIKQEVANSEVISNFDILHADLEKGVVESKLISVKLDNHWNEVLLTASESSIVIR